MKINFINSYSNSPVAFGISQANFKIKNIDNIRCPVCNQITLTPEQIEEFIIDISNKKGVALAEALEKRAPESYWVDNPKSEDAIIYRKDKEEIVQRIEELAIEHPEASLGELAFNEGKRIDQDYNDKMLFALEVLGEYIERKTVRVKDKSVIMQYLNMIRKQIGIKKNRRAFYDSTLVNVLLKSVENEECKKEIIEILNSIPKEKGSLYNFFVMKHYRKRNKESEYTARTIINNSRSTVEHMVPSSKKGKNAMNNFMVDCQYCNAKRRNIPFISWSKTIPDFKENLEEYVKCVTEAFNDGKLNENYSNYASDFAQTVSKLTKGRLQLDVDKTPFLGKKLSFVC